MFLSWLPLSSTTMDVQSFRNFQPTKVSVLVTLLLPLPIQLSLASQPIPAYSVKKDFWSKTSKYLSYLCSSLSAAWAAFSVFGFIALFGQWSQRTCLRRYRHRTTERPQSLCSQSRLRLGKNPTEPATTRLIVLTWFYIRINGFFHWWGFGRFQKLLSDLSSFRLLNCQHLL